MRRKPSQKTPQLIMLTAPSEDIRGQLAHAADDATSVLAPDWLEAARLRPPRHAARVYKEVFRTVFTANSYRAPCVETRQFDSNLPLHSTPKTNQAIPSLGIYPVTIQSRPHQSETIPSLGIYPVTIQSRPRQSETIPSLGIYPVTITLVRDGHGLCTNGHRYLATRARSNRITIPFSLQPQSRIHESWLSNWYVTSLGKAPLHAAGPTNPS